MTRAEYNAAMKKVDALMMKAVGMTHEDLGDFCSWDCVEEGLTPEEVTIECLDAQDWVSEEVYAMVERTARGTDWETKPARGGRS